MKKLKYLLLLLLIFNFAACNYEIEEIKRNVQLESISLDIPDDNLVYSVGQDFSTEGIKLYGHYSDGSVKEEDASEIIPLNFNSSATGPIDVNLFYKGFIETVMVTIEQKSPDHLSLKTPPRKLIYSGTEKTADTTALEVNLVYDNGQEIPIASLTDDCNIDLDFKNKFIRISYRENLTVKGLDIPIVVDNSKDLYISVIGKLPIYRPGDEIDYNQLTFNIMSPAKGKIKTIDYNFLTFNYSSVPENYNEKYLSIVCKASNSCTANFSVEVIDAYSTGIELNINSNFYTKNYEGNEIKFTNTELFEFYETFDKKGKEKIELVDGEYEFLRWSTTDTDFEHANKMSSGLKLTASNDIQKIYFYHKYKDYLNNGGNYTSRKIPPETLSVKPAKLESIKAEFNLKDKNTPVPLEASTPNLAFENKYGTWDIKAIWTNKEVKINPEDCTFTFVKYTKDSLEQTIKVTLKGNYDSEKSVTVPMTYGKEILTSVSVSDNSPVVSLTKTITDTEIKYKLNDNKKLRFIYSNNSYQDIEYFYIKSEKSVGIGQKSLKVKKDSESSDYLDLSVYISSITNIDNRTPENPNQYD